MNKLIFIVGAFSSTVIGIIFPFIGMNIAKIIGLCLMYEINPYKYHESIK